MTEIGLLIQPGNLSQVRTKSGEAEKNRNTTGQTCIASMTSTRRMQSTTVAIGGSDGVAFDGITDIKDVQKAVISRIVLTFDNYIRSIAVRLALRMIMT